MGDLKIKPISIEDALELKDVISVTLKRDGTLLYWQDRHLISPTGHERDDRFPHVIEALQNCPVCMGEMYISGGRVSDVMTKENWPKARFMVFNEDPKMQQVLDQYVLLADNWCINSPIGFVSVEAGWQCVMQGEEEGLVIKTLKDWYKVKRLCEDKVKIVDWLPSKTKGTFILENGNKVSGTKMEYVEQFKARKCDCIAEIEYPYLTKEGHYFQPRLRQITETHDVESTKAKA